MEVGSRHFKFKRTVTFSRWPPTNDTHNTKKVQESLTNVATFQRLFCGGSESSLDPCLFPGFVRVLLCLCSSW